MKVFDFGPHDLPRRDFLSFAGKGLGLAALSSSVVASLLKEINAALKEMSEKKELGVQRLFIGSRNEKA